MTRLQLLLGALGLLVVSLIFGSVYTTGALWVDQQDHNGGEVPTGDIGLSAGSGSASGTFPLEGTNFKVGDVSQAQLTFTNIGTTKITFSVSTAGPADITPSTATVGITLAAGVGSCPATTTAPLPSPSAFGSTLLTQVGAVNSPATRPLAKPGSETWCVRATLSSVGGAQPASFTIKLNFSVQQDRP